jgi:glycosyltransferase involved in cell wall biosynthesis
VTRAPDGHPFVSVIVPVRDGESTIADCLDAILATDYPEDRREILAVDNGSTDGTATLIQSRPVRYLREERRGVSNTRNRGIAESRGEILDFVDADCIVEPQWLTELVRPFEDPEVGSVAGDDLARDLELSLSELIEAAGGRPGIFRRFIARGDSGVGVAHPNGDGAAQEESAAG